jgi:hypothetical protein
MMLNGLPWQQTEWKDDYLNGLIAIYPEWRDRLTEFYSDTSNNGYAYWVFFKDMTVEQARQSHPIESATVQSPKYYLYRTFDDYAQDGGAWTDTARGTIKCPMTDFLASYAIPLPQQRDFAIVLYLDDPKIYVTEGSKINPQTLDVAPYCPRGSTLVPVRGVFEALGGTVEWVNETRQIIITKGDTKIMLRIGSKLAMVDGRSATLLEPAQLRGDRTMIPLRFISEVLGYKVEWFGDARKIIITLP